MKKTISIMGLAIFCLFNTVAHAQESESTEPAKTENKWDPKNNPTVTAITSKYEGKMLETKPALTKEDIFPVIGTYEATTNMADTKTITIALDENNKGLVWIEGLPQGTIKAMLRKSPATYKIPAQKTEAGNEVAEGTLVFDKESNTLSICIGKSYNAADPLSVFSTNESADSEVAAVTKSKKTKTKQTPVITYTATKQQKDTVSN